MSMKSQGRIRSVYCVLLLTAISAMGASAPLPWSFTNGTGKGYAIKLESAVPEPGTTLHVGQSVDFKVNLSYQLSAADEGTVVLVFQDETNRRIKPGATQQHYLVKRGEGPVTLEETLTAPEGAREVRLFIPIMPKDVKHTSGELVLRYPVVGTAQSSSVGYPTAIDGFGGFAFTSLKWSFARGPVSAQDAQECAGL
jgi:hypothetical protein